MSEKGGGSIFDGPYRVNEDNQPICSRRKQSCRNCGHHFIGRQHSDSEYDLWESDAGNRRDAARPDGAETLSPPTRPVADSMANTR